MSSERGKKNGGILVLHCIAKAQFNTVVSTNTTALSLYKKLGFVQLGVIPRDFLMKDENGAFNFAV